MKILLNITTCLFLFSGCSSYVNQLHHQMDQEYREDAGNSSNRNSQGTPSVALSRQHRQMRGPRRQRRNRGRYRRQERKGLSSAQTQNSQPSIQRKYGSSNSESNDDKRTRAEDLRDQGDGASLWASDKGQLFYQDTSFKNGDIILINVMDKLKDEITLELRRAFPPGRQAGNKQNDEGEGNNDQGNDNQGGNQQQGGNNNQDGQKKTKIHDRISSVVVEKVNQDHILLRGRKELLYRNRKRLVEIQALVAKRDIDSNDTVKSDQIIESRINVLR